MLAEMLPARHERSWYPGDRRPICNRCYVDRAVEQQNQAAAELNACAAELVELSTRS